MDASLTAHFEKYIRLSPGLKADLDSRLRPVNFKKGQLVHDAAKICETSYFVQKGLLHTYFFKDGAKISEYFSAEEEWVNSPRSFMQHKIDIYFIEAIEDSSTYGLHVADLVHLFNTYPEMDRYARLSMGTVFGHFLERITSLRFTSAKEKYAHFVQAYAGIYHRIPLHMVASYLGITPETLSRIRTEK